MKIMVQFDATVSASDIKSQLFEVSSMEGVREVRLWRRLEGDCREYLLEIDAAEAALKTLMGQVDALGGQFAGFVSNLTASALEEA
jgi:hypothetical protein